MRGIKLIETRSHNRFKSLVGRTIGIHASQKRMPRLQPAMRASGLSAADLRPIDTYACPGGALLGTVDVVEARWLNSDDAQAALCGCRGRFGLILANPRWFCSMPLVRGRQGIWYYTMPMPWRVGDPCEAYDYLAIPGVRGLDVGSWKPGVYVGPGEKAGWHEVRLETGRPWHGREIRRPQSVEA
jgi:hypothetical protein